MALATPRRSRAVLVALALVAAAAAFDGVRAWRQHGWNESIATGAVSADADFGAAPPELRFAQAHALAARGEAEPALQRYRALQGDAELGRAARYNSANLMLQQAIELRAGTQPGQAIALIELAKEMYRDVLRADPQHWAARYNLERAQRLLPEPDEADAPLPDTSRNAERAVTTMRGYSPGLP